MVTFQFSEEPPDSSPRGLHQLPFPPTGRSAPCPRPLASTQSRGFALTRHHVEFSSAPGEASVLPSLQDACFGGTCTPRT